MEDLSAGPLEIKVAEEDDKYVMCWFGSSEEPNPSKILSPYLAGVIGELAGKELVVDFTKFGYMNSSTVPPIFELIRSLEQNKIKTLIIYRKDLKWQVASFKALETIIRGTNMNSVVIEGR